MRRSFATRIQTGRRGVAVALAGLALLGGGAAAVLPQSAPPPAVPSLSEQLGVKTWALAIPIAWLAAPIPGLRHDDVLDVLGTRTSERANASEVATGLRVMSVDERTVVVELTSEDASAIAAARARGLSLIPILRSVR